MAKPRVILLFGPQGSGKGTQAELLAKRRKFVYLSTGELLRREVSAGTALGQRVQRYVRAGRLVPDAVVNELIAKHLQHPAARRYGVLLDGYPRSESQADFLDRLTMSTDVISLTLTDREAIRRIGGRRLCANCGRGYHVLYQPPRRSGICDACGGKLIVRPDDTPAAIRRRLQIFRQLTQPLLARYGKLGLVREVDGSPSIPQVFAAMVRVLKPKA